MRYFIGFLVTIGLIILLIYMIFRGGDKQDVPDTSKTLESYATTSAEVSLTIDGQVIANQEHRQIRIIVGRTQVTYQEIAGYEDQVVNQQTFANNQNAYEAFLIALQNLGFTEGNTDESQKDERGVCPLGQRYIFMLNQDGKNLERFWSTSCGGAKTYDGNSGTTITLFQNQVPGYSDLTQNVAL